MTCTSCRSFFELTHEGKSRNVWCMVKLVTKTIIGAFALLLAATIVPGVEVSTLYIAIITAVILGILNAVVRPILLLLTLPINLLTLGLFIFIINALLFWFASTFVDGFAVAGFFSAFLGSLLVSAVTTIGNKLIK